MDFNIYKIVFGQIVRHFASAAAIYLSAYGVGEAQQGQLTEAVVYLSVGIAVFLVSQAWSYISKRLAFLAIPEDGK